MQLILEAFLLTILFILRPSWTALQILGECRLKGWKCKSINKIKKKKKKKTKKLQSNYLYITFFACFTNRKDVRLPQQLQRAMAAEAEASREARAKVSFRDSRIPDLLLLV